MDRPDGGTALLVVVLLIAGCSVVPGGTPSPASPAENPAEAWTATVPPGSAGESYRVRVVEVVDGDTMRVRFATGEVETIRLVGVDAPELRGGIDPEEWESIPSTEAGRAHLREWGRRADAFARAELERGERVRIVVDPTADRRGSFGRLLVYLYDGGDLFNLRLLEAGYARLYETRFGERERFAAAEATAREAGVGVWDFDGTPAPALATAPATETPGADVRETDLRLVRIHADAAGNDHDNPDDEYLVFENPGDDPLDLSGWRVEDAAGHVYHVPDGFTLAPGETVTLYTGSGTDAADELYWGSGDAIWNNGGDVVLVFDDDGDLVLRRSYE